MYYEEYYPRSTAKIIKKRKTIDTMIKKYVDRLIELEPVIQKAGELAVDLRKTAKSHNKFQTGEHMIDIVTEADLAVQEMILSEIAKTDLVNCRLIAEEDTPSVKKFIGTNGLTLTIDPIDGTFIYASSGRFFSVIVCLYYRETPLYTFFHYPDISWSRRITQNKVVDFGERPKVKVKVGQDYSKTIVFTYGDLAKVPKEVLDELKTNGYEFINRAEITKESGSTTLLFLDQVAGFFVEKPCAYDGLSALSYGKALGLKIYSDIDLLTMKNGDHGHYYNGWYIIINEHK
jgi:hypothetical protein